MLMGVEPWEGDTSAKARTQVWKLRRVELRHVDGGVGWTSPGHIAFTELGTMGSGCQVSAKSRPRRSLGPDKEEPQPLML